jgi:hypothetical protein
MSDERDIDIETFRETRWQRFRARLSDFIGRIFQRGWSETEAEVCTRTVIRTRRYQMTSKSGMTPIGGYAVTFKYVVDGKTFDGVAISPDEVQKHDRFVIRYNPRRPEENNSFDSATSWTEGLQKYYFIFLLLVVLCLVVAGALLRR